MLDEVERVVSFTPRFFAAQCPLFARAVRPRVEPDPSPLGPARMPWLSRKQATADAEAVPPPLSPELEAKLKDLACAIQACASRAFKAGRQLDACTAEIAALRDCCREEHARSSVHCTAAWVNGSDGSSKQQKK